MHYYGMELKTKKTVYISSEAGSCTSMVCTLLEMATIAMQQ